MYALINYNNLEKQKVWAKRIRPVVRPSATLMPLDRKSASETSIQALMITTWVLTWWQRLQLSAPWSYRTSSKRRRTSLRCLVIPWLPAMNLRSICLRSTASRLHSQMSISTRASGYAVTTLSTFGGISACSVLVSRSKRCTSYSLASASKFMKLRSAPVEFYPLTTSPLRC